MAKWTSRHRVSKEDTKQLLEMMIGEAWLRWCDGFDREPLTHA